MKQHFATTSRHLTQTNYDFSISEHFFSPLYHASTKEYFRVPSKSTKTTWQQKSNAHPREYVLIKRN